MWQLVHARDCVLSLYGFYTVTNIVSSSIAMLTIYVLVVLWHFALTATKCSLSTGSFLVDFPVLFMANDNHMYIIFFNGRYSVNAYPHIP